MSNVLKPVEGGPMAKLHQTFEQTAQPTTDTPLTVTAKYLEDKSRTMLATEWHGTESIKVVERPAPDITDPSDAVIRVTSCTVCGSDSHMYFNELPAPRGAGMQKGDIMGHESMGVVDKSDPMSKILKLVNALLLVHPLPVVNADIVKKKNIPYVTPLILQQSWKICTVTAAPEYLDILISLVVSQVDKQNIVVYHSLI